MSNIYGYIRVFTLNGLGNQLMSNCKKCHGLADI